MNEEYRPLFEFLLPGEGQANDPLGVMMDLRSGVEELSDTTATYQLGSVLSDHDPSAVQERMVLLLGSWRAPGFYSLGSTAERYVNPSYVHRHTYPDTYEECECGALMVRLKPDNGQPALDGEHEHAEGCKRSWRLRTRADLLEARVAVMRRALRHGISARSTAPRFGLDPGANNNSISAMANAQRANFGETKEGGKRRRLNTERALLAGGYSPGQVGAAWGVTASTIRERIATMTDEDLTELYDRPTPWQ